MSRGRGRASVESCGRRGPVPARVVFESTPPQKHPIAATHKGLRGLATLWRGGVRGYQASGIRRFAVRKPPRGRLGSLIDARKRRHRMRGRLHWWIQISTGESSYLTAASMETCQFVALRSPRARLGSVLDMGNCLRRLRRRFQSKVHLPCSFALHCSGP